ncbi:8907_t:CDS:10 [Ambispora gerdemannii]|uniref:8907_t:CDS:1 n=1 Tax=Ambispora gerdemannii TaxID=144530 RepID=A0A9N8YVW9_9GLOM|nr:8907_t:CDS:10 [Ambispora gerdemannii]
MFRKNAISLEIEIDENFTGIMYGTPDESAGCQLKGKVVLRNKKTFTAKQLFLVFTGQICVTCGPLMSSRPEYYEEQTLYRKLCYFLSTEHTNKQIPSGTHEFYFEFDLPGHLPTSFKGTRGKIEYYCHAFLDRPVFYSNMSSEKSIITLKRCLMKINTTMEDESAGTSFNINRDSINNARSFSEGMLDNNNVQYQISTPVIAYCEGGLVSVDLFLKPMNSDITIESVEYGLKEYTSFHTTGEASLISVTASIYEETFPLGKRKIKLGERANMIPIHFRLFPRVKCDLETKLIELNHKLSFTITVREGREGRRQRLSLPQHHQFDDTEQCNSLRDSANIIRHRISSNERRRYQYINSLEALEGRRITESSQSPRGRDNDDDEEKNIRMLQLEVPIIVTSKPIITRSNNQDATVASSVKKRKVKSVPAFPDNLYDTGYMIDESGQLCYLCGKPYNFHDGLRRESIQLYDHLVDLLTKHVCEAFVNTHGLKEILIPFGATQEGVHSRIFVSPDIFENEKMTVFVPCTGYPVGVWSRRVMVDHSVPEGSMLKYTKDALDLGFSLIITNPNEVYWCNGKPLALPRACADYQPIPVEILKNRVKAIDFVTSTHSLKYIKSGALKHCRNWVISEKSIGEEVVDPQFGCVCLSSGHTLQEFIIRDVRSMVFNHFLRRLTNEQEQQFGILDTRDRNENDNENDLIIEMDDEKFVQEMENTKIVDVSEGIEILGVCVPLGEKKKESSGTGK